MSCSRSVAQSGEAENDHEGDIAFYVLVPLVQMHLLCIVLMVVLSVKHWGYSRRHTHYSPMGGCTCISISLSFFFFLVICTTALEDFETALCRSSLNKVSQICDGGIYESCQQLSESSLHNHNTANVLLPPLLQVWDYKLWSWVAASAECDAPCIDVLSACQWGNSAYSSTYTSLLYRKEWCDY